MWRKLGNHEAVVGVAPGSALTIPRGTHFQFRVTGSEPLRVVLCTMPPWPGEQEAARVPGHWPVTETVPFGSSVEERDAAAINGESETAPACAVPR